MIDITTPNIFTFHALGGANEITLEGLSPSQFQKISSELIAIVKGIETKFSRFRPESIISLINKRAGTRERTKVDSETAYLLNQAHHWYHYSGGLFDITSGVLRKAWNFAGKKIPGDNELKPLLSLIGWDRVYWKDSEILLPDPGMEIDLGGLGKEHAVDCLVAHCKESGVKNALINLAGDTAAVGTHISGKPWRVGVVHPRVKGEALTGVELKDCALATSGDYERFFEVDGVRYCHILNPQTGYPVTDLQSVSIKAPRCIDAGALATVTMLLGSDVGIERLQQCRVSYLVVTRDGEVSLP